MKISMHTSFATSGAIIGMLLVLIFRLVPLVLVFGVGPAIVGGVVVTAFSLGTKLSTWRVILAIVLSIPAYVISFVVFAGLMSFMQRHGSPASSVLSDMNPDVLCGLLFAVVTAGILLETLAWLLSNRWSTASLAKLVGGGIASVALAYIAKVAFFHFVGSPEGMAQILILFGPLFILGGALTTMVMGQQIKETARPS